MLVLRLDLQGYSSILPIRCIWLYTGIIVGIPVVIHRHEMYYGNSGFCTNVCYLASLD